MKTKMFFVAIATVMLLASCTSETKLVGKWDMYNSVSQYWFNDNGTYDVYSEDYNVVQYTSAWSIENGGEILVLKMGGTCANTKWIIAWKDDSNFEITCTSAPGSCSGYVGYNFKFSRL